MVLYYTEPTVSVNSVDDLFMKLQNSYRSYEKELNQMKAELKETVNNINRDSYAKHQIKLEEYQAQLKDYKAIKESLRSEFLIWKTNESERISKLKITIPESLKDTFKMIQQIGDTSK
jgi:t-SNARE complex subunit (syntaxin)